MSGKILVSVLLPSRGRPASLHRAVSSLLTLASDPDRIQICYALDHDDQETITRHTTSGLYRPGVDTTYVATPRHGYAHLYRYFNAMVKQAQGRWTLLFNDDTIMQTSGWDDRVATWDGQPVILDCDTNTGPFVDFPLVPLRFIRQVGHYAPATPHVDSYWQDIGRALGIIRRAGIQVHHDRFDLTGGHNDATWREGRQGLRHHEYFAPDGPIQAAIRRGIDLLRPIVEADDEVVGS